jgi:hypothetical protein
MSDTFLSSDDLFILGNVGARAILSGFGADATRILSVLQTERPSNAGSFLMQAVYMFSSGQPREALRFLESSPIFTAEVNGDEAVAFFLVLLKETGEFERAKTLGATILDDGLISSESARHAILKVLADIEDMPQDAKKTVLA